MDRFLLDFFEARRAGFEFFSVRRRRNTGGTKRDVTEGDDGARRLCRDGPSALQRQVTSGVATKSGNDVGNRPQHGGHETGRHGTRRDGTGRRFTSGVATKSGNDVGDRPQHGGARNGTSRKGTTVHVGRCNEIGQRRRQPAPARGERNGTSRRGTTGHDVCVGTARRLSKGR